MFVKKSRLTAALADRDELRRVLAVRDAELVNQQLQYGGLHNQFSQAKATYAHSVATLQADVRALLERLIDAEGEGRKSSALIALWTVRVNQLQLERDQLLARCLPGLEVRSPQLVPNSTYEPTISFEHDPDYPGGGQRADHLTPVPIEPLDGLPGDVYTPSLAE